MRVILTAPVGNSHYSKYLLNVYIGYVRLGWLFYESRGDVPLCQQLGGIVAAP